MRPTLNLGTKKIILMVCINSFNATADSLERTGSALGS